jgi:hypothetical protein
MPPDSSANGNSGTPLVGLTDQEERLALEIEACLESGNCEDTDIVRTRFSCLKELGAVVSRFPSIRKNELIRGELWDEGKFIASVNAIAPPSRNLRSPVRVIAVRNYLIAKSNVFSLLSILIKDRPEYYIQARRVIFRVACTLMIEEVYSSCLKDLSLSEHIRFHLADNLAALLDSGMDARVAEHLPALESLWAVRSAAPPSFGTMDGSSELTRIMLDLGDEWHTFLADSVSNDETRFALEEFLFGFSYEEILEVRSRLNRFGISAVGADEVHSFLGSSPAYAMVNNEDPRMAYDFYILRRDAAEWRRRTNAPGPQRTLEEIYLKYRIITELLA